ncbi:MAG: hypothetical protein BWY76_02608 [bacterium ADurb.Bin429]|nr:MAG: hypothetical protein BWY76_02608 [bacterium ADurb.Bin429]
MRKVDADDCRKELGGKPHGKSEGKKKRIQNLPGKDDIHRKDGYHQNEGHLHKKIAEFSDAAFKFGFRRPQGEAFRNPAEFRSPPGVYYRRLSPAAHDMGAHKKGIGAFTENRFRGKDAGHFLYRVGLSGQCRFVDKEVVRLNQPAVAGDGSARREHDDISGDNLLDRHLQRFAVARNLGRDPHHGQQRGDGAGCLVLLPEAEQAADEHNKNDNQRVGGIMQKKRQYGGA